MFASSNPRCQGFGTAFSNTFLSLKLALKVVSERPIMFFQKASMLIKLPKIHVYSLKAMARASGLHFLTPSWAWRWYQNIPITFFHRSRMLTKIPKIHVYSFKTLNARASGLHFPTPLWAWGLPWECPQKSTPRCYSSYFNEGWIQISFPKPF